MPRMTLALALCWGRFLGGLDGWDGLAAVARSSLHFMAYLQRQIGRVINCETQHFSIDTKCLDFEAIV